MSKKIVVVYDTLTGLIKQMVRCDERHADKQHLPWPGHDYLDVTVSNPRCDPEQHSIDITTKKVVPRTLASPGHKSTVAIALEAASRAEESAQGSQQDLVAHAFLGGAAEKAALASFMAAKAARQVKLQSLLSQVSAASNISDLQKIAWGT